MIIAFFVNDMDREYAGYTTTVLAYEAHRRGHGVCYVTPDDFLLAPDDRLHVHGRFLPKTKFKDRDGFFKALQGLKTRQVDMAEVDILMLRSDPSLDANTMPWAAEAGILFGREAAKRGTIVVNDPDSLAKAINKLYFQSFPAEARAETLISRNEADIKAFARTHKNEIILKPLQGSGGSGVFKLDDKAKANINQMIEAIGRDGYIIAQAYVPAAKKGDIRLFLMNGLPLQIDGKYAALRRVASKDDIRSNIHAGGTAEAVEIGKTELRVAEIIRPKLLADGMFLVGIDIVGDKILEVNVFSPGNLGSCSRLAGVDFARPIIDSLERKAQIASDYAHAFDNRHLAVL